MQKIFLFLNESSFDTYQGNVFLPTNEAVVYYDVMENKYEAAVFEITGSQIKLSLELAPGECAVIMEQKEITCDAVHKSFRQQKE